MEQIKISGYVFTPKLSLLLTISHLTYLNGYATIKELKENTDYGYQYIYKAVKEMELLKFIVVIHPFSKRSKSFYISDYGVKHLNKLFETMR